MNLSILTWDINKGKNEYSDQWPLMQTPLIPLTILAAYLGFVLKFGPRFMEKRKPYNLKEVIVSYNAIQVVLSVYMTFKFASFNIKYGIIEKSCGFPTEEAEQECAACIWLYTMAKISELLDTVFFVLRKKNSQLSFLHLFHHSTMMACSWFYLKYAPALYVIFYGALNSLVHVVMYTYYAIAAMGPQYQKYIWWKKYTTVLQLLQFTIFIGVLIWGIPLASCPNIRMTYAVSTFNITSFFVLFANFYRSSYKTASAKSNKKESELLDTTKSDEKERTYNKLSEDTSNFLIQRHSMHSDKNSR